MLSFGFDGQQAHKEYTGIYEGKKKIILLKNVPIRKKSSPCDYLLPLSPFRWRLCSQAHLIILHVSLQANNGLKCLSIGFLDYFVNNPTGKYHLRISQIISKVIQFYCFLISYKTN